MQKRKQETVIKRKWEMIQDDYTLDLFVCLCN